MNAKVYCEECRHFRGPIDGQPYATIPPETCEHTNAFEPNYKSRIGKQSPPRFRNGNNDCKDFEAKE